MYRLTLDKWHTRYSFEVYSMAWDLSHITKQVEEQAVEHAQDIALENVSRD